MEGQAQSEEAASNLKEFHLPESSTPETSSQDEALTDEPVAEGIEKDDQTKEELQEQPLTNQESGKSASAIQAPPTVTGSNQLEEFIILDHNGQALQCERMVIVTGQSQNGQVYMIPSNQLTASQVLIPHGQLLDISETTGSGGQKSSNQEQLQTVTLTAISGIAGNAAIETTPNSSATATKSSDTFVTPMKPLPRNAPSWALRLRSCEKIGDSYRGYCSTEAELEAVLLLHKQQTQAVFGTRQSPSPAKAATRLMWKSQYVPYDGIPFVNAGSRAIVMECQFGPRRKGLQPKRSLELESQSANYKATCPARIYIKKVRKFPEYRVPTDPKVDKKVVRQEQEKAFFNLKKSLWDMGGVIRYYVQLPTQKAHLYHDMETPPLPPPPVPLPLSEDDGEGLLGTEEEEEEQQEEEDGSADDGSCMPSRLHPLVAERITQLVAQGYSQVYTVRKQLRKFVEREMFKAEKVPEKHNLCYFPTVNDIKNHIHEAQKALQQQLSCSVTPVHPQLQWAAEGGDLLTETVTLTLTPASVEVNSHKSGMLEGSDTLSPEAVQLFSSLTSLQPKIFAQLQGLQLRPASSPLDGAFPVHSSSSSACPLFPGAPDLLEPTSPSLVPQPLLMGPASFLPSSATLVEGGSIAEPPAALLGMGQLVSVSALGGSIREGGAMHQILLEDGQTIPVQIVDPTTIALTPADDSVQVKEEMEDSIINTDEPTGD
ncbi:calcium-responsive transcription factor isoform X2 [Clupea harengus]|uniref:Calcium-responsive transcription factor isoform X2 n=1 Tax=Clupea harengus TaxID=7950 RepID=A0A6P8GP50_CLUHA|nr:calcium-responsive transcription factor isoform X2 [Clupea harengus]